MAKDINNRKLSKVDSAMPSEDSDKRAPSVTESLGSLRGKSEVSLTEPVKRRVDEGEFLSDGADDGGSVAVDVNSTSEVVLDGKHAGDADAGIDIQRISEDRPHESSATLSMLDIDLVSILLPG